MADFKSIFETDREPERIAKRLARAGVCSRRDAERLIEAGRVTLDGEVLSNAAINVDDSSVILVDGQPIPEIERPRLWRYHKPRGQVTTDRDPEGRPTVFDNLPEDLPRVISVGRLDMDSEGLLLLTNDGELARLLELPSTGWLRRYRVRVFGKLQPAALKRLSDGITIEGVVYGAIQVTVDQQGANNSWLTVGLREGKNREIRRVMEYLGLQVNRLIRISFGPFQLGDLDEGRADEVKERVLRDQLGVSKTPSSTLSLGEDAVPKTSRARPQRGPRPPRSRNSPTRDEVWYDKAHRDEDRPSGKGDRGRGGPRPGPRGDRSDSRSDGRPDNRSGGRFGGRGGERGGDRGAERGGDRARDRFADRGDSRPPHDRPERSSGGRPERGQPGSGSHGEGRPRNETGDRRGPPRSGPSGGGHSSGEKRYGGQGSRGPARKDARKDIRGPGPARRSAMREDGDGGDRRDRKGPRPNAAEGDRSAAPHKARGDDSRGGKGPGQNRSGPKGPRDQGAAGRTDRPRGTKGPQSARGPEGAKGPQGAKGPRGAKGPGGRGSGNKGSDSRGAAGKGQGNANRRRPPSRD